MWEQGLNFDNGGGGFYESSQGGGMPGTPSTGEKKRQRAQNLVPVKISDILESRDETLKIEGMEVGMVAIVGMVETMDHQATKSIYTIRDDTGTIEVMQWKDENSSAQDSIEDGAYVRVVGSVRTQQDRKHVMVFKICKVSCDEEIDAHLLEIVYARYKIRQLIEKQNSKIGMTNGGGIGYGQTQMSTSFAGKTNDGSASLIPGLTPAQDAVYRLLRSTNAEEGLSRDELISKLNGRLNKGDVNNAVEYLSNEGHIYSTLDDDHFKSTDS